MGDISVVGSGSWGTTLAMLVAVSSLLALGTIIRGRITVAMVQIAAIVSLAFGWVLPLLASAD